MNICLQVLKNEIRFPWKSERDTQNYKPLLKTTFIIAVSIIIAHARKQNSCSEQGCFFFFYSMVLSDFFLL